MPQVGAANEITVTPSLRSSGLGAVGDIPWGTHFCLFYATKSDLLDALVPYFAAGLAANEYCLWVTSNLITTEEAMTALRNEIPLLDQHIARGQLKIIGYTEWYTLGGSFQRDRVLGAWYEALADALRHGFDGLRISGDTFWLETHNWNEFMEYEAELDRTLGNARMLVLCTYSLDKCGALEGLSVSGNHEFVLQKAQDQWQIPAYGTRHCGVCAFTQGYAANSALFKQMGEGLALHEIITDETGTPCDGRFLDVNTRFERLTSLRRTDVCGKRVLEVLPDLERYWIEAYGRVAQTGRPERFEGYMKPLDRWYDVFAYQTAPGRFATFIRDITGRKQAEAALRWREKRNELLADAAALLLESIAPQSIERLCRKVMEFLECQVFFNYIVDEHAGRLRLNASAGILAKDARDIAWLDYGEAICGHVANNAARITVTDIQNSTDERSKGIRSFGVQIFTCHPLMAEGKVAGTLGFGSHTRTQFTSGEIEVMQTISGLVAMAINRVRIEEALRASEARLSSEANFLARLDETGSSLWHVHSSVEGLNKVLAAALETLPADMGFIQLQGPRRDTLTTVVHSGFEAETVRPFMTTLANNYSASGRAFRSRKRVVIEDVQADAQYAPMLPAARAARFRAVQSTPFVDREGEVIGVITTCYRAPQRLDANHMRRLDLYARKAADFIERCTRDVALRESEERLRAVMNAVPVGISVVGADSVTITSNAAFDTIWGRQPPAVGNLDNPSTYKAWRIDTGEMLHAEDWASTRALQYGETVVGQLLRIETFDNRIAYINNSAAPICDAEGNAHGTAIGVVDITEQIQTLEALRRSQQDLNQAQHVGSIGNWRFDLRTHESTWSDECYRIFNLPNGTPVSYGLFLDKVHPDDRDHVKRHWKAALTGEPYDIEHRIVVDGEEKWVREKAILEFGTGGKLTGAFGVTQDITERKQREKQIQLLLREVNHRAKNMLALVQAMARQTAASDPELVARFSERIQSLAASQDLLVRSEWRGVEIGELIHSQLAHFQDLIGRRIVLSGQPLRLSTSASQSIGMAVHELATNAGKYGALSTTRGRVDISWRVEAGEEDANNFALSWTERDGPPVKPPTRQGFGYTVIVVMPRVGLRANVELNYTPSGMNWRLVCPAARVIEGCPITQ